ncbi:MAG TPA: FAD-binding oxidoreductase [Kineosporiaceae bacterium]|nr:FAD-binding oxidoreductase [Kineosporiaceae bacterium]
MATTSTAAAYRSLSLWHDTLLTSGDDDLVPRPALDGDLEVDVCVVGAGFTGLWTAYSLLTADPSVRVAVLEAEIAGFGASGRNGGWCSALFPASAAALSRRHGRDAALALRRAMNATVTEVGRVVDAEGIDAHWRQGGTLVLARTPVQLERARAGVAADAAFDGVDGLRLLEAGEARERIGATRVLGATFTPHCARVHPARLVRGLAHAVERRGGTIHEGTRAERIMPGPRPRVETARGTVRADVVVRATEAWTAQLPGSGREVVPVYSLMVATEPLPASFWATAGLAAGETFSDHRHLIIYGQRTADGRLAFGGRGAPYHAGSRVEPRFDRDAGVFAGLRRTLTDLFPGLHGHAFTHAWGGPLGIARDWHAGVGLDRPTGIAWAGGYVGDGVGASNLAGRTLADLILGRDTGLTRLPWVGHRSRRWEPEPLRWLGVNAGLRAMTAADAEERLTGRPSLTARALAPLLGH